MGDVDRPPRSVAERERIRAIAVLGSIGGVLLLAFLAAFAYIQGWVGKPGPAAPSVATSRPSCPAPKLPDVKTVTVNVYNSTERTGLAATAAKTLKDQGFAVGDVKNDPLGKKVAGVAEVRYGQAGAAKAQAVALRFPGAALVNDGRAGDAVDVALGEKFAAVGTATAAPAPTTC